ncbi:MAG: phosphoribosylformylglycinamidine synthase subunit PurQ [Hyphomicrobiaceae bacterium]
MRASVIVFPGSNCDRDVKVALEQAAQRPVQMVWHGDTTVPPCDLIVLPGGFSYGDYLRCGAMAAHAPIMRDVIARVRAGTPIVGICNGFQILTETGLLPGTLLRNGTLKFVCREVWLKVENTATLFTSRYPAGSVIRLPIAHGDGNYFADDETLARLEGEGRIVFRYVDKHGRRTSGANPNGSAADIAGICGAAGRILGLMPHPERHVDPLHGGTDGRRFFESIVDGLAAV